MLPLLFSQLTLIMVSYMSVLPFSRYWMMYVASPPHSIVLHSSQVMLTEKGAGGLCWMCDCHCDVPCSSHIHCKKNGMESSLTMQYHYLKNGHAQQWLGRFLRMVDHVVNSMHLNTQAEVMIRLRTLFPNINGMQMACVGRNARLGKWM